MSQQSRIRCARSRLEMLNSILVHTTASMIAVLIAYAKQTTAYVTALAEGLAALMGGRDAMAAQMAMLVKSLGAIVAASAVSVTTAFGSLVEIGCTVVSFIKTAVVVQLVPLKSLSTSLIPYLSTTLAHLATALAAGKAWITMGSAMLLSGILMLYAQMVGFSARVVAALAVQAYAGLSGLQGSMALVSGALQTNLVAASIAAQAAIAPASAKIAAAGTAIGMQAAALAQLYWSIILKYVLTFLAGVCTAIVPFRRSLARPNDHSRPRGGDGGGGGGGGGGKGTFPPLGKVALVLAGALADRASLLGGQPCRKVEVHRSLESPAKWPGLPSINMPDSLPRVSMPTFLPQLGSKFRNGRFDGKRKC